MHLIQYYCIYTYYTCSIKSGKTFQHNIEQVKISFYYKTSHLHIQNWIKCLEFYELHNKAKIWPSSQLRPQMCPPPSVPPAPVNVFPRRGEQCPVEEFSYKGYSPPRCTCNGKHTYIQVKICTFLLECLHAMDENVTHPTLCPESSPTPSHMQMPSVKTCHLVFHPMPFLQNKIFLFLKLMTHWANLQCSFDLIKSRMFMHLWAMDFGVHIAGHRAHFQHFYCLSSLVIMSNC